jgi:cobalt/nickel transport system ATP-binding protein
LSGTKLVATHDLDFVLEVCERVVMLENGRLFADGKVKTILADATLLGTHGFEVPYLGGARSH